MHELINRLLKIKPNVAWVKKDRYLGNESFSQNKNNLSYKNANKKKEKIGFLGFFNLCDTITWFYHTFKHVISYMIRQWSSIFPLCR
jgi:hypothetical protein